MQHPTTMEAVLELLSGVVGKRIDVLTDVSFCNSASVVGVEAEGDLCVLTYTSRDGETTDSLIFDPREDSVYQVDPKKFSGHIHIFAGDTGNGTIYPDQEL